MNKNDRSITSWLGKFWCQAADTSASVAREASAATGDGCGWDTSPALLGLMPAASKLIIQFM